MTTNKLAESIYEELLRAILAGEYAAGERLPPERQLADRFDTNRNTLREATSKLAAAGLVRVRQGQGLTVADFRRTGRVDLIGPFMQHGPDVAERLRLLHDLLLLRTDILDRTVRLAAERAKDGDIDRIASLIAAQKAHAGRRDSAAVAQGDLDLIEALVDASHSLAMRWAANALLQVARGIVADLPHLQVVDSGYVAWLDGLLDAVRAHDAEAAARVTRTWVDWADSQVAPALRMLEAQANREV